MECKSLKVDIPQMNSSSVTLTLSHMFTQVRTTYVSIFVQDLDKQHIALMG